MMMPCSWPVDYSECKLAPPDPDDPDAPRRPECFVGVSEEDQDLYEHMASEFLWLWTRKSLGLCPVSIQPCREYCYEGDSTFTGAGPFVTGYGVTGWGPVLVQGSWYNVGCARCGDRCGCDSPPRLSLPGPIASVDAIFIDGEPVDPWSYWVENETLLVRPEGWPDCGLTVCYQRGRPVPLGGRIAAGILACEFYLSVCGDRACRLPQRVRDITRQGVTMTLIDDFNDIDQGRTGIWMVDSWVAAMTKPTTVSTVRSPDIANPRHRRVTWRAPIGPLA